MNERIRELALEARIAYYSKNGSYEGSDDGLSVIPSTQSLEKFAELIVRECADWVRTNYDSRDAEPLAFSLEKDFGLNGDYAE